MLHQLLITLSCENEILFVISWPDFTVTEIEEIVFCQVCTISFSLHQCANSNFDQIDSQE